MIGSPVVTILPAPWHVHSNEKDQRGCDICECSPAPNGCPSADADGVSYESNDPAVCAVQNFVCPAGTIKFDNERCGCGCQPATVDICPIERSAVCGTDGQTYRNQCYAQPTGIEAGGWRVSRYERRLSADDIVCHGVDGNGVVVPVLSSTYPMAAVIQHAPVRFQTRASKGILMRSKWSMHRFPGKM